MAGLHIAEPKWSSRPAPSLLHADPDSCQWTHRVRRPTACGRALLNQTAGCFHSCSTRARLVARSRADSGFFITSFAPATNPLISRIGISRRIPRGSRIKADARAVAASGRVTPSTSERTRPPAERSGPPPYPRGSRRPREIGARQTATRISAAPGSHDGVICVAQDTARRISRLTVPGLADILRLPRGPGTRWSPPTIR